MGTQGDRGDQPSSRRGCGRRRETGIPRGRTGGRFPGWLKLQKLTRGRGKKDVDLKLRQCRRGHPPPCARWCRYLRNWMILTFLYNNYFSSILVSQEPCRMRKSVV